MIPWWVLAVFVFGANFTLWSTVGLLRLVDTGTTPWRERYRRRRSRRGRTGGGRFSRRSRHWSRGREPHRDPDTSSEERAGAPALAEVAVLIAAHNENLVIEDCLESVIELVPRRNIHVVSDGSDDDTFETARRCGVKVIRTRRNVGKAGALQEAVRRFDLVERYRFVLLLDADTRIDPDYFRAALPLFDDPQIVAVAGCVRSDWQRRGMSPLAKLLVCHRQRIYALTQHLLKFGQTWRHFNATHIVPGFASVYRTEILPSIEMNPPGLVIEDFNMTFEVYQKGLGKVGFTPSAIAVTQDPGTLRDYVRQTRRWALGWWQTVRRHRPRANLFTCMLGLLLLELLVSSVLVVLLPLVLLVLVAPGAVLAAPGVAVVHGFVSAHLTLVSLLVGVVLPDLLLTCAVALLHRRARFLWFAGFFLPLRVVDSVLSLLALLQTWRTTSTGRWHSPGRRVVPRGPGELSRARVGHPLPGQPSTDTSP